jgi:hypothetical protein
MRLRNMYPATLPMSTKKRGELRRHAISNSFPRLDRLAALKAFNSQTFAYIDTV